MLKTVLIANRGEIACRIIRATRKLGMKSVAVFSRVDATAPHVRLADTAIEIGPAPAGQSYLRGEVIIAAALAAGAECVHPGYGFLSENAEFAQSCLDAGLIFVGPPPSAIRAMGFKDEAKTLMERAGVPVIPGYSGDEQSDAALAQAAHAIGYPIMIKAVAGGGGKGMRRVDHPNAFQAALASCRREASAAFGTDRVLLEKLIEAPRHIEFQIFADTHGDIIHLNERDCSSQRRHQKIIEEAPAPDLPMEMRLAMGRAAIAAGRAVDYVGAGTVEFIVETGAKPRQFYFMEMNTRLQVEHPVTEAITGIDLVEWQFRIASGERLPLSQGEIITKGHAVEARVYAEDPASDFTPSSGKLWALRWPGGDGIRVDAGVEEGGEITPFYDPMLAKIIAQGPTRDEALSRLSRALGETIVAGPRTNLAFLKALCDSSAFRGGAVDTSFIDRNLSLLSAKPRTLDARSMEFGVARLLIGKSAATSGKNAGVFSSSRLSPWATADAFQMGSERAVEQKFESDGHVVTARVTWRDGRMIVRVGDAALVVDATDANWLNRESDLLFVETDDGALVLRGGFQTEVRWRQFKNDPDAEATSGDSVASPMHGKVISLLVKVGDIVHRNQRVAIVEAMKMEHALNAPIAGRVAAVSATEGAQVARGARLLTIEKKPGGENDR